MKPRRSYKLIETRQPDDASIFWADRISDMDEAERLRAFWLAVIDRALMDAERVKRLEDYSPYGQGCEVARRWLATPSADRNMVLELADIEPEALDRAVPHLLERWASNDDELAGGERRRLGRGWRRGLADRPEIIAEIGAGP